MGGSTEQPSANPRLFGRETDLQQALGLLGSARVVTLLGPPGIGKTALARSCADSSRDAHAFVELGGVPSADQVGMVLAAAVGAIESAGRPLVASVAAALPPLVVLDSCEGVVEALGPFLTSLTELAANTRFLATSREPLRVDGEVTMRLGGLTPSAAIELLRARSLRTWDDSEAARLCDELDHLPLAIELAAEAPDAPTGATARDASPIDITLAASLDRIGDAARRTLALLASCPGGLPAHAVDRAAVTRLADASLVDASQDERATRYRVIDPLRDATMRMLAEHADEALTGRLGWCRTVAALLRDAMHTQDEANATADADAEDANIRAVLSWALDEGAAPDEGAELVVAFAPYWLLRGRLEDADRWIERARARPSASSVALAAVAGGILVARGRVGDAEAAYTQAADHGRITGDVLTGAAGVAGLAHLAVVRGDWPLATELSDEAIELTAGAPTSVTHLTALHVRATVARVRGDLDEAERFSERGLQAARDAGNRKALGLVLLQLGGIAQLRGDRGRAVELLEESASAAGACGAHALRAAALGNLGSIAAEVGDTERGRTLLEQSLAITRSTGDIRTSMITLSNLGELCRETGDPAAARPFFGESLEIARRLGDRRATAWIFDHLGGISLSEGDIDGAATLIGQSLATRRQLGDKRGLAFSLESAAAIASRRADHTRALQLIGAADALRDLAGTAREPSIGAAVERVASSAADEAQAHRVEGRAMTLDDATAVAEAVLGRQVSTTGDPSFPPPAAKIAIRTLGGFAVYIDGEAVAANAWQSRKARDLVKILVSRHGQPVPREALVELLWPEADDDPARLRSRLSVALSTVRTICPDAVVADRDTVGLDVDNADIDVRSFLDAVSAGRLEDAVALYTGEFLPEDVYADWTVALREEARLAFVGAARALARVAAVHEDVVTLSIRILEQDPYDDEAHRLLITSLRGAGRYGDAKRAHELFGKRMSELGLTAPDYEAAAP